MALDEKLLERVRKAMASESGATERNMFGGVCFSINGNMACGVQKSDLVVRVGPDDHEDALEAPFTRPMDFTGRPMNGFVYVDPRGCNTQRRLDKWVDRGVTFARTLPRKKTLKKTMAAKRTRRSEK